MKKALCITLLSLLSAYGVALSGNAEWRKVDSVPPEYEMRRSYIELNCSDSMNCLIRARSWQGDPVLRLTTDGGETWKDIYKDSTRDGDSPWAKVTSTRLNMIAFPSPKLIIAIGDSGRIIRSTDLGATWDIRTVGKKKTLRLIKMLDDKYGVIQGNNMTNAKNEFFETSDGGVTWLQMKVPQHWADSAWYPAFYIIKKGLIYTKYYQIYDKTYSFLHINGNWDSVEIFPIEKGDASSRMFFINDSVGWMGGGANLHTPILPTWIIMKLYIIRIMAVRVG